MHITVIGINHMTAPVHIRERLAVTDYNAALINLRQYCGAALQQPFEAALLSTCNRNEIYVVGGKAQSDAVFDWCHHYFSLPKQLLNDNLQRHSDSVAVKHLYHVVCGLDSMVLGEQHILGQVKDAYECAHRHGVTGKVLNRLFQSAFRIAKRVRTDTAIGVAPLSVAHVSVQLLHKMRHINDGDTILLIGAGKTIELVARYLSRHGHYQLIIANRTIEKARRIVANFGGTAIALADIHAHLPHVDCLISCTASQTPLLGTDELRAATIDRQSPLTAIDLAVPRDLGPDIIDIDNLRLYTIDDIRDVIDNNQQMREQAAQQASVIINDYCRHFLGWFYRQDNDALIRALHAQHHRIKREFIERAKQQLVNGKSPEAVIEKLANQLTAIYLHAPSEFLHQHHEQATLDTVRALYALDKRPVLDKR